MQISRHLKLVLPIYEGDEVVLYVYAEPISRLAFEAHHKIMARAWSDLSAAGIGSVGLMTTAAYCLKDAAIELYGEEQGIIRYHTFMTEVLRLATAIIPSSGSFQPVAYENAKGAGKINEDDAAVVESLLAFFTLSSRMVDPSWGLVLRTAIQLNYSAQYTPLSCTEYLNSLQTSTKVESSGEKAV